MQLGGPNRKRLLTAVFNYLHRATIITAIITLHISYEGISILTVQPPISVTDLFGCYHLINLLESELALFCV